MRVVCSETSRLGRLSRWREMNVDCSRHVGVPRYADLYPYMSRSWRKHFERDEFTWSVHEASTHIWLDERSNHEPASAAGDSVDSIWLGIPYQALTINGWADGVAAKTFLQAVNRYGEEHWQLTPLARRAIVVSAHDPAWSAHEIRSAAAAGAAAVAIPLTGTLLGSGHYDPIYDACSETGLPLVVHYSGTEGKYLGSASLPGGVHLNAFARAVLMPQLAESNVTSLTFEGAFEKFPGLQVLFAGFGFKWLPTLAWRMDREWRTFRHDVPWVKRAPSSYLAEHLWLTTWPINEVLGGERVWEQYGFSGDLAQRVVYGSHQPFDGDQPDDLLACLGDEHGQRVLAAGARLFDPSIGAVR